MCYPFWFVSQRVRGYYITSRITSPLAKGNEINYRLLYHPLQNEDDPAYQSLYPLSGKDVKLSNKCHNTEQIFRLRADYTPRTRGLFF